MQYNGDPEEMIVRVDGEIAPRWKIQQEYEAALRLAQHIASPPPQIRHTWGEHIGDPYREICARCGISKKEFHQVPYGAGLPCRVIITDLTSCI